MMALLSDPRIVIGTKLKMMAIFGNVVFKNGSCHTSSALVIEI